jgi:hypothetical protein
VLGPAISHVAAGLLLIHGLYLAAALAAEVASEAMTERAVKLR